MSGPTELRLRIGDATTVVHVAAGALGGLGVLLRKTASEAGCCVVVTDDTIASLYLSVLVESLRAAGFAARTISLPPGEASKSLQSAARLYSFLSEHAVSRDAVMVALGGGVIGDLAGFVAATWMRGIALVLCPTTLEAMIDACLGGKTAVNLPQGKNLIGAFHPAMLAVIDPNCLNTLPPRDLRAGLAESVKHALIASEEFFAWHEDHDSAVLSLHEPTMVDLIVRNLRIKCGIVEQDPFERTGRRMVLNFGHTIGHALETCADYALRHGECVALGMLAACRISNRMSLLPASVTDRVASLFARLDLPMRLPAPIEIARIIETLRMDKKTAAGKARFVLLSAIGHPTIRNDVPEPLVREASASLFTGTSV